MISQMTVDELRKALAQGRDLAVIDVREIGDKASDSIEGAEHIPLERLAREIREKHPDKDEQVVLYCEYGIRSHHAARLLRAIGYQNVREIQGGLSAYRASS